MLMLACSRGPAPTPAAAPTAPKPEPPPKTDKVNIQLSFAAFDGNDMQSCIDVNTAFDRRDGMALDRAVEERAIESMIFGDKKKGKPSKVTRLKQPCINQFGDRTAFATCRFRIGDDAGHAEMRVVSSIYSFRAAFGDDRAMRGCLEVGGDWAAIPRNSPEFQQARLHHDMGSLRRMVDKAAREDP